jgi:hypothetical protein
MIYINSDRTLISTELYKLNYTDNMRNNYMRSIFLLLILFPLSSFSQYVVDCTIFDKSGVILRKLPGLRCIFLDDGSFISGTLKNISRYGPDFKKVWEKEIGTHHQLNLGINKNKILVQSSTFGKFKKTKVRFDKLLVLDLDGNIESEFSVEKHQKELLKIFEKIHEEKFKIIIADSVIKLSRSGYKHEFSHLNSFYEIPENDFSQANPFLKKGNYIANFLVLQMIVILDSKLEKILWYYPIRSNIHDVQVQKSGWMLYFDNLTEHLGGGFSSLAEMNPISKEIKVLYQAKPKECFYSIHGGGVQKLSNGNFLFNDRTKEGRSNEVDQNGVLIWTLPHIEKDAVTGLPKKFQQVKFEDLNQFLKKNRGI